jgi:hypothetical protein
MYGRVPGRLTPRVEVLFRPELHLIRGFGGRLGVHLTSLPQFGYSLATGPTQTQASTPLAENRAPQHSHFLHFGSMLRQTVNLSYPVKVGV